ncbi:uncharacterized protein G2W53_007284 [Senna tora]|uniref:Uncharacterized protein n=1 Tax=Senna tora TaxID=362788 RepID=A0A835CH65_9FABA|nr:uncharacterized protein G2W53_007284 [Senna tora]
MCVCDDCPVVFGTELSSVGCSFIFACFPDVALGEGVNEIGYSRCVLVGWVVGGRGGYNKWGTMIGQKVVKFAGLGGAFCQEASLSVENDAGKEICGPFVLGSML